MGERREITRAICWLPPRPADRERFTETSGGWSRTEETVRLLGRIGYKVITETFAIAATTAPASPAATA